MTDKKNTKPRKRAKKGEYGERISFRAEPELVKGIEAQAGRWKHSRSLAIRRIIKEALENKRNNRS